jgi:hypothetical protein
MDSDFLMSISDGIAAANTNYRHSAAIKTAGSSTSLSSLSRSGSRADSLNEEGDSMLEYPYHHHQQQQSLQAPQYRRRTVGINGDDDGTNDHHWFDLPVEIRQMIFSKLELNNARIALVCKSWRLEFFHSRLEIDLSIDKVGLMEQTTVRTLIRLAPRTRRFSLHGQERLWFLFSTTDALLNRITQRLPTLPSVNGLYCSITDIASSAATMNLNEIGHSGQSLWANHVPRYLNLVSDCGTITDSGLQRVQNITDRGLHIAQTLPDLSLQQITDSSLNHIAHLLPKSLHLARGETVSDKGAKHIARHLPLLRELDLAKCNLSDYGMQQIALGLPNLTALNVSHCQNVSDKGIRHIAAYLPRLRLLNVARCSIGQQGLRHITEALLDLQCLTLDECKALGDRELAHLAAHLSRLRQLSIAHCEEVTDTGIRNIATRLTDLRCLNVGHCHNLTDIAAAHMARLVLLEQLDVRYCYNITDVGVYDLTSALRNLTFLNLEYCYNVLDVGLNYVGQLRNLQSLRIGGCSSISDAAIDELRERHPNLMISLELS